MNKQCFLGKRCVFLSLAVLQTVRSWIRSNWVMVANFKGNNEAFTFTSSAEAGEHMGKAGRTSDLTDFFFFNQRSTLIKYECFSNALSKKLNICELKRRQEETTDDYRHWKSAAELEDEKHETTKSNTDFIHQTKNICIVSRFLDLSITDLAATIYTQSVRCDHITIL